MDREVVMEVVEVTEVVGEVDGEGEKAKEAEGGMVRVENIVGVPTNPEGVRVARV